MTRHKIVPDIAIPPGELLAEEIEVRGMTQRDLAKAMGRSSQVVSAIVRGVKVIDARTAIELGAGARDRSGLLASPRGAVPARTRAARGGVAGYSRPRSAISAQMSARRHE